MKRAWLGIALLLSLGLNLGILVTLALKRPGPPEPGSVRPPIGMPDSPREAPRFLRLLAERHGLDEAEIERLAAGQRRLFEAMRDGRAEVEALRRELRQELIGPDPDRQRIEELLDRVARLQRSQEGVFVDHVLEVRDVLDGEAEAAYLRFLGHLRRGFDERDRARPGRRPIRARPGG